MRPRQGRGAGHRGQGRGGNAEKIAQGRDWVAGGTGRPSSGDLEGRAGEMSKTGGLWPVSGGFTGERGRG
jgi:hypothetical protein